MAWMAWAPTWMHMPQNMVHGRGAPRPTPQSRAGPPSQQPPAPAKSQTYPIYFKVGQPPEEDLFSLDSSGGFPQTCGAAALQDGMPESAAAMHSMAMASAELDRKAMEHMTTLPEEVIQKNTFVNIELRSRGTSRVRSKSEDTGYTPSTVDPTPVSRKTPDGSEEGGQSSSTVDDESPRGRHSRLMSDEWPSQETPHFAANARLMKQAAPNWDGLPGPLQNSQSVEVVSMSHVLKDLGDTDRYGVSASPSASSDARVRKEKKDASARRSDVTMMLRNIPNRYTQDVLLEELRPHLSSLDFFYLPIDFRNQCNLGYAFLNFKDGTAAEAFKASYDGYRLARYPLSHKVLQVNMARVQGLKANVKRLRQSTVMSMLTDENKPVLFHNGEMKPLAHSQPKGPRGRTRPPPPWTATSK